MIRKRIQIQFKLLCMIIIVIMVLGGCKEISPQTTIKENTPQEDTLLENAPQENTLPQVKSLSELVDEYRDLKLTDVHNHDASGEQYLRMLDTWKRDAVSRIVLFGNVSESSAIITDKFAWDAYQANPELFIPYFSGFDLHHISSLEVIRSNLEKGYFGLGEIAAASTYSPVLSKVEWKAEHPMDGYLPEIYDLCAEYKVPILLHIDPPNGTPVAKLEEALIAHPDTIFIFAHINVYNTPDNIVRLMEKHKNLYADFFAGFTDLNQESSNTLEDFVPVVKQFPDRFLLSTDSGYGLSSEEAVIESMYRFIDILDDIDVSRKIAHDNFDAIIQAQPVTKTQLEAIQKLQDEAGKPYHTEQMSKFEAGTILAGGKSRKSV